MHLNINDPQLFSVHTNIIHFCKHQFGVELETTLGVENLGEPISSVIDGLHFSVEILGCCTSLLLFLPNNI